MLFFVSVGLLIEPRAVQENLGIIAVLLLGTFLIKSLTFGAVVRLFGFRKVVPWAVGLTLWQIGEFSFVLAQVGAKAGAVSSGVYNLVMVTAVLSMIATPATSSQASRIRKLLKSPEPEEPTELNVSSHVLIGGYGRVGVVLARSLAAAGIDFVAVDPRPDAVRKARELGHRIVLGDLSSETILDVAGAFRARLVVLTMPDPIASNRVAEILRHARPDLPILARGVSQEHCRDLKAHGVRMALWPEFECGLELTKASS
jgi:CPA2 family monovalent cation:H+ antiporter-2